MDLPDLRHAWRQPCHSLSSEPRLYGRRRPDPSRPALRLGTYLTGVVPAHPLAADYLSRLSGWQMLGNDQYGDCVAVTWANVRRLVTAVLSTEHYPSLADVITVYKTQNPGFPAEDNGMDIQTLLGYLVKTAGPDGVKALGFAKVDYTNPDEVKAAIAIFGSVWVGTIVQQAQETQFSNGQPWDYVSGVARCRGHGSSPAGTARRERVPSAATSGSSPGRRRPPSTDNYWSREVEEAWVVLWPEHLGSAEFLAGVDLASFAGDYTEITGQPFPAVPVPPPVPPVPVPPVPTPVPVPPVPGPDINPADVALAHSVTTWAYGRRNAADRAAAAAIRAWLVAKEFAW